MKKKGKIMGHKVIVFLSHDLDIRQKEELKEKYKIEEIIFLPEDLQKIWSNVRCDENYEKDLEKLMIFMNSTLEKNDCIIAQGNWGYVYSLVTEAKKRGYVPLYGFSYRDGEDKIVNGEKIRISKFKHIKYIEY
jgi:uncharacterized protein MJ1673